jgi:hypothetical protein
MRLDPDAPLAGVGDWSELLQSRFTSGLPTVATLEGAWADPRLASLLQPDKLGRALATTSVRAMRFVNARMGVDVGVPAGVLDDFAAMLSIRGSDQAIDFAVRVTFDVADALIDAAVEAMGAVPFVGWVAKLVKAMLDLIQARIANKRPAPPLITYDEGRDEDLANATLQRMRGYDWTPLFMPVYAPNSWGDWEIVKLNGGWLMRPKLAFVREGAGGALPGGPLGSAGVQSRNCVDLGVPPMPPGPSLDPRVTQESKLQRAYTANFARALECIVDVYETTPSQARIALAAWQAMTAKATPALFQVDTRPIVNAWKAYTDTGLEASQNHRGNTGDAFEWRAWRNLADAMYVRNWRVAKEPKRTLKLHEVASLYVADLKARQLAALHTSLAAYCREDQAAFRGPELHAALMASRQRILATVRKFLVHPGDIVDLDFRAALLDARANGGPARDAVGETGTGAIPGALPLPSPKAGADAGGGGGGGVLAVGAALAGALLLG